MKKFILCILLSTFMICQSHQNFDEYRDIIKTYRHSIKNKNLEEEKNQTEQETTRVENQTKTIKTWTEPLIINAKNYISRLTFTENISYNPGKYYNYPSYYQNYPAAIIIDADNVVIDLAGFNLSLNPSSAISFLVNNPTFGIAITAGTKNVKIISSSATNSKGSITDFTGYAIYMLGSTYTNNSYDIYQNYIKNIVIDNLSISYNTGGIYLSYGILAAVTNSEVVYNFSSRPVYGISFSNVFESCIKNSKIDENYSWSDIAGIYLEDTIDMTVDSCQISHQESIKKGDAIGIQITATSPLKSYMNTISKCIANTNLSSYTAGKESIGFSITGGSHTNIISECETFYNSHGPAFNTLPPVVDPKGYGIKLGRTFNNQITKNKMGYHSDYGIFDIATISSSFYSNNIAMFNPAGNYSVTIPTGSGSEPLPVVLIYQNTLDTFTYTTLPIYGNLSILAGGT
ncbi:hypothetical protein KBC04_05035 [Candidatus Babeliales bacterium]|nr:hypothetical protein [Candidatus Babeliales bacterium]MBP9844244.1 hypothetical protein [Candidatus Babeliales bacterium]